MIPISALKDLYTSIPGAFITKPVHENSWTGNEEPDTVSYIRDRNGDDIGAINWADSIITIFSDYEYAEEVMESIGKDFEKAQTHFDPDEPIEMPEPNKEIETVIANDN